MNFTIKYHFHFLSIIGILLITGFSGNFPDQPKTGFWSQQGKLITHFFEEKTDSLSGPELFELQDENGLPIWFGRHIFKDVCISGECKMIRLWLFWDGAGNYLGMQIPEEEPLTKSDHTEFEPEDYEKLSNILRDTTSILKTLKQEDLIIVPDSINPYEVDGYTAATQPTLAVVVVKDAVYTCHTLWHTVYGPVKNEIFRILENRISKKFLFKMFESNKPEYISWAIESVEKHPEFHTNFYPKIMEFISSENSDLANQTLEYFQSDFLADTLIQHQLVRIMNCLDMYLKNQIIWKFIELGHVDDQVVYHLLKMFIDGKLGVMSYNYILRLITSEHLEENEHIIQFLNHLARHENIYIRNLTQRILNEKLLAHPE